MQPVDQLLGWRLSQESLAPLVAPAVEAIFPTGRPRLVLYTQVSKVQNHEEWAARIILNTLARLALDNPELRRVARNGPDAPECQRALDEHWRGFIMAAAYPTENVDFNNYILFALIILKETVLIEQVQSLRMGRPGGWNLIRHLVSHLASHTPALGVRSLHTAATNPRAATLFERNGFSEITADLFEPPVKYRKHLARSLTPA